MWGQIKQCLQVVLLGGAVVSLGCGSDASSDTDATASNDDIEAFIESNPQYAASPAKTAPASNVAEKAKQEADPSQQALDLGN